jgi:hypothetical protein
MKTPVPTDLTTDTLEQQMIELESLKSRLTARQLVLLREADRRQVLLQTVAGLFRSGRPEGWTWLLKLPNNSWQQPEPWRTCLGCIPSWKTV